MAIAFLILLVWIIFCVKKLDDGFEVIMSLSFISFLVIAVAVYQGHELVCWVESPQAMTIEYVLQYMR